MVKGKSPEFDQPIDFKKLLDVGELDNEYEDATPKADQVTAEMRAKYPDLAVEWDLRKQSIIARAETLQAVRQMRGMTQAQLAEALGISQAGVSKMEQRENPSLQIISKFLETMGGRLKIAAVFEDYEVELGNLADNEKLSPQT